MNRRLIFIVALLLLGSVLGFFMQQGSGYILISFQHWVVETSLWVFVMLLTASVIALYITMQLLAGLMGSRRILYSWRNQRGMKQALNKTTRGLVALAEGNWKQSEKLLLAGAHGDGQVINYLAAARAAHQAGNYEHSDALMAQAIESTKGAELAVGLQQSRLQLERKQYEQSLATCLRLKKQFPKHQYVNEMLLKTYSALEDWQGVIGLLPKFSKYNLLPSKRTLKIEVEAYGKQLGHLLHSRSNAGKDPKALLKVWRSIPSRVLKNEDFIPLASAFIECLITLGEHVSAERELRKLLTHHWNQELVRLYGCIMGDNVEAQLAFIQDKLKHQPEDAISLLTLGRLSLSNQLFDEAQGYFEQSLERENSLETRSELSRLYLAKDETQKALDMLRQGLGQKLPRLPLPA
ncbi:MAG: heme biosynthesis HemY N-terminal domain-containing protein [Bermanella sp.]